MHLLLKHTLKFVAVAISIFFGPLNTPVYAADLEVDLQLILAVDVSSSMNEAEQDLQRAGYVAAISDPIVIRAIQSGLLGKVAITYVEWAGAYQQSVVVPWRVIDSEASAIRFSSDLDAMPIVRGTGTSISASLRFAASLFVDNGFESHRRVIDISGDGPNNYGPHLVPVRDEVVESGIVINGLPVILQPAPTGYNAGPSLIDYYRDCVIGGAGSFVVSANSKDEIATAIRRKLVQEIASVSTSVIRIAGTNLPLTADCMIGQKDFHE